MLKDMKRTLFLVTLVAIVGTALAVIFLPSCGPAPAPRPEAPAPGGGGGAAGWDSVKALVQKDCAGSGCHDGTQRPFDEARFKSSKAKARLEAGTMPPGGRISAADKSAMLNFLGG